MGMSKCLLVSLIGAGTLGMALTTQGVVSDPSSPTAWLTVTTDGQTTSVPVEVHQTEKGWDFTLGMENSEFMISGGGSLNPDPSISYSLGVTDFGDPSVFGFAFGVPIVPTGPQTIVNSGISGELTDFTGDGIDLTPAGPLVQTSSVGFPTTPLGVDVGPAFSAPPGTPGATHSYGPHAAGSMPGPVGNWTFLTVSSMFGLSGGGDSASLAGFAEIETDTAVGVPDSGAGLVGWMALFLVLVGGTLRQRVVQIQ